MIKDARKDFDVMIAYGDLHFPHNNAKLSNILLDVIEEIKPDIILDGGDIISCDCIGEYNKNHKQLTGLQQELKQAHAWLESIKKISPKSKKIMLTDNHFTRRLSDKKKKEIWLEDLEDLSPEKLLKLDFYGWEYLSEYNYKNVLFGLHGDYSNGSQDAPINRARKTANNNGVSIFQFHGHNTGMEIHRHRNGHICAVQFGGFEDEASAGYIKHPGLSNWSNSFGIFYLSKLSKEFFLVMPYFINNKCIVNGKVYG